ncbi:metallophosphoesterase [Candidatus Micrarchaeota archaeon]|nr:metallophosphoesterase [Candidatus Micrarchaeota archaeon]
MKFIRGTPALVIGRKLVIADLHLGFEKHVKGLNVGNQTKRIADNVKRLLKENCCNELIILGDIKHSVTVRPDLEDVQAFVSDVKRFATITLVMGNHDGSLQNYLDIRVVDGRGYRDGKYYFMHGHAAPKKEYVNCTVISSHIHPVIAFRDNLGGRIVEKIWLIGERLVIMPAFNPLIGGIDVRKSTLDVLEKRFDRRTLGIYLLDGLYLCNVGDLPEIDSL